MKNKKNMKSPLREKFILDPVDEICVLFDRDIKDVKAARAFMKRLYCILKIKKRRLSIGFTTSCWGKDNFGLYFSKICHIPMVRRQKTLHTTSRIRRKRIFSKNVHPKVCGKNM